jgi:hypothetical protein
VNVRSPWVSRVLVVLASLLAVLACLAIWVDRQLLNTDHWTDTSAALLRDRPIQGQLAKYLSDELFSNGAASARIAEALPPRLAPLAGPASAGLSDLAERLARRALSSGALQKLWVDTNRATHRQFVALTKGEGVVVQGSGVVLDLRPLLGEVAQRVGLGPDFVNRLPAGKGRLVVIRKDQLDTLESAADLLRGLPIVVIALMLIAFGTAVALAPERRRDVLRNCGIGLLIAGLFVLILRRLLGNHIVDAVAGHGVAAPAAADTWTIATSLLAAIATSTLLVGAAVIVGTWFAGPGERATGARRQVAPLLVERPGVVYAGLSVLLLIVLVWGPFEATRSWLGALVFTLLAAAGAFALDAQIRRELPPGPLRADARGRPPD